MTKDTSRVEKSLERIVVRGVNWVGDAMMTIPALRELRRLCPDAHITLVVRPSVEGVFTEADFVDEVLLYERRRPVWSSLAWQVREWRERRFDAAILFQNAFEAALLGAAARVPLRIGYATDNRRMLLTHPLGTPAWRNARHEVFYYLNIVHKFEELLAESSSINHREPMLDLHVSDARRDQARRLLREHGAHDSGKPLVVLCPGSINSRAKRWPAASYALLADKLIEHSKADVALIGSRSELDVSRQVGHLTRHQPIVLTGRTSLAETVAVLSIADLLVTNDTGPAHIAAGVKCPQLVIFGPTIPATTRPFSDLAEIIRRPPSCAPCMLRDCPIDHRCMTAITPDEVYESARQMLLMGAH